MKEWICIKSMPKISFAHIYSTKERYVNHLPKAEKFFEIGYLKVGSFIIRQGKEELHSFSETISIQIRNDDVHVESNGLFEIHCVGIRCDFDFEFPKQTIKIPNTDGKNSEIMALIDEIIATHNLYPDDVMKKTALIFNVLDKFNQRYSEYAKDNDENFGEIHYVNKIKTYVINNVHKKIKLKDIADILHISESYLCIVFKKVTGESVISFINKYKLGVMKNLIITNKMSLKEASAIVGITDSAYASRLFKKYENQSLREFKCTTINKP